MPYATEQSPGQVKLKAFLKQKDFNMEACSYNKEHMLWEIRPKRGGMREEGLLKTC